MNARLILAALLIVSMLPFLPAAAGAEENGNTLYVRKVENLPVDFIFGMDVSSVLAEEASGVKYHDFNGEEADLFRILRGKPCLCGSDRPVELFAIHVDTVQLLTDLVAPAGHGL